MNVDNVPLRGGLATRVVGFVNEFGMSIAKLASTLGISEPEAQKLYIRAAQYIIEQRTEEINELVNRMHIVAAM